MIGVATGLFYTGGWAFSPGELSAVSHGGSPLGGFETHAAFQDNCQMCHTPFAGVDAALCTDCHQTVAAEIDAAAGLHVKFTAVTDCGRCHAEHMGLEADLRVRALTGFDHRLTPFDLIHHAYDFSGEPLDCTGCHESGAKFQLAPAACADCHREADPLFMAEHEAAFPGNCVTCHDGLDTMAAFSPADHARFFPLEGAHAAVACTTCHQGDKFAGVGKICLDCHQEPAAHRDLFDPDCTACHGTTAWQPARLDDRPFDHAQVAGFSLAAHQVTGAGEPFQCVSCHTGPDPLTWTAAQCATCHQASDSSFMSAHIDQYGLECLACHDGVDRMAQFDHNAIFPLTGRHAAADCTACHLEQQYQETPATCEGCHAEPAIHAGLFGTRCAACHTADGWQPARLTIHTFPLDHGEQGELACTTCHAATYTEFTCAGCHEHRQEETARQHEELNISTAELADCARCHPTGQTAELEDGD